jgi:hypothetical protein
MDYGPEKEPVQLEGDELDRMRKGLDDVATNFHAMAELVLDQVYGKDRPRNRLAEAHVVLDNHKFVFTNGDGCGVYEDPPGWCRECTPEEEEDVNHAGGT